MQKNEGRKSIRYITERTGSMASFAGHGTTAPASSHTYLNFESDQNPFGGRQFLNVGTNEHVYLTILTVDLVLFPNAILPLLTRGEAEKQIIEEIIGTKPLDLLRPGRFERDLSLEHRKGFFGVCLRTGSGVAKVGTLAEIYRHGRFEQIDLVDDDDEVQGGSDGTVDVNIVAKGRKRFEIVKLSGVLTSRMMVAIIRLLPDGENTKLPKEHPHSAVPRFVWKMHDCSDLLQKIIVNMCKNGLQTLAEKMPHGTPCTKSFWLAINLPLSVPLKYEMLTLKSTFHRLNFVHKYLESMSIETFACKYCRSPFCRPSDVFSMSDEGVTAAYVNPQGYVHQIMTLKTVNMDAISTSGEAVTEHSWFPGFAWTIVNCIVCGNHFGWMFTAVDDSCHPSKFFGIRKDAVIVWNNLPVVDRAMPVLAAPVPTG